MLDYLVGSETRQKLLIALFRDGRRGNVSELAALTAVSFSGAHAELEAMREAGLAERTPSGNALVYRARMSHPHARLIVRLAGIDGGHDDSIHEEGQDEKIRSWLASLGAPLGIRPSSPPSPEQALVAGAKLAHRDATVARVLPVCIHKSRWQLDPDRLLVEARRAGEKQALGFFLDLTSRLSGDRTLSGWARRMRDRRVKRTRDFFGSSSSTHARRLAGHNTPPLARRWRFRMNMSMDSFQQAFHRHVTSP